MQKKSLGSFCLAVVLELGLAYGPPGCAERESPVLRYSKARGFYRQPLRVRARTHTFSYMARCCSDISEKCLSTTAGETARSVPSGSCTTTPLSVSIL